MKDDLRIIVAAIVLVVLIVAEAVVGVVRVRKSGDVMTINTDSPTIRFVDEGGKEVGSIKFEDEYTLTIRRRR